MPLREETVPNHNIIVRFSSALPTRTVRLQPSGDELAISRLDDDSSVTVPRLDVHAMVVAELDDEAD